jgi:hypothetical protein
MWKKRCPKCEVLKDAVEGFARNRSMKDGRQTYCRICCAERYQNNTEHMRAMNRAWYAANKSRVRARERERAAAKKQQGSMCDE